MPEQLLYEVTTMIYLLLLIDMLFSQKQFSNVGPTRLILASQSPRRREILDMMGLSGKYTVIPSPIVESDLQMKYQGLEPEIYTRKLAEGKALALGHALLEKDEEYDAETFLLGSDTIVDLDGVILEKPNDTDDAISMLRKLSGRWHLVHTGVAIYRIMQVKTNERSLRSSSPEFITSFTETTRVKFAELNEKTILSYVSTSEPMDKAGSYGIQGIGGQLVERIDGCYFAVMGLPMSRTSRALASAIAATKLS
jgi:septum formation protein